jgi:hypothetical protein
MSHIMQTWREDGVPADLPVFITESNLSSAASETYMDIFSGIWLADYVGSFLNSGGNALYYFHYLPLQMEHGCNDSPGTFAMFTVDKGYQIQQPLAQFFAAQLINLEWVQPGAGEHRMFPAKADIDDGAGHALVTAYALQRPDETWSLMIVNRDQQNAHRVKIAFQDQANADMAHPVKSFIGPVDIATFGRNQYEWHPAETEFLAHSEHSAEPSVVLNTKGFADPDGPILRTRQTAAKDTAYDLPAASVVVIRGKIDGR